MNRLLLALLLAAACKHSSTSSSTSHTETSTVTDTQTSESGATTTTTTVTEQPGETTTTTEEFAPPTEDAGSEPGVTPALPTDPSASKRRAADSTVPRHGPLVKRTVTTTRSGGETTQTRQETRDEVQRTVEVREQAEADAKAQAQTASAPSAGCVGASWIWGLGILAFAVAAILGILKFRRAV